MLEDAQSSDGVITKRSPVSVAETVGRLQRLIEERGLTLFAVVDHSGSAEQVGLHMPDTKLVIFGSPQAGTPVMLAAPLAALDLPLKVLVSATTEGVVSVSYNAPGFLAERHHLVGALRAPLDAIEAVVAAIIGP